MLFINDQEVLNVLNWEETFEAIETAMIIDGDGLLLTMPGYLEDNKYGALACKLVTAFNNNDKLEKPLPVINANIALFDQQTGLLNAVIAGTEITKWRTAAASAVATKQLFLNNSKECKILALLGCGVQGKIHAEAFHHFFGFTEIRLWNRTTEKAREMANELNRKFSTTKFKCVPKNEECVKDADVIVTATFATSPIVEFEWVKEGAHINAVGAGTTHHSELSEKLYMNSDVYVDHWAGAKQELSGLEELGVKFKGEMGNVIAGDLPRSAPNRITVFQSLGKCPRKVFVDEERQNVNTISILFGHSVTNPLDARSLFPTPLVSDRGTGIDNTIVDRASVQYKKANAYCYCLPLHN
ncbi:hypothetical protein NQ318_004851 [Aromia moschata]|uniref:Ketimine reductase mu-crystallin n=1 Tax=Aromia moschata TaxID=1265417 RepID=A0AAV8Z0N1_9CUCU|nr:hypothetical protein NQ318_004851 [Aromia moschata]